MLLANVQRSMRTSAPVLSVSLLALSTPSGVPTLCRKRHPSNAVVARVLVCITMSPSKSANVHPAQHTPKPSENLPKPVRKEN